MKVLPCKQDVLGKGIANDNLGGALVQLLSELIHAAPGDPQGCGNDERDGRAEQELAFGRKGNTSLPEPPKHRVSLSLSRRQNRGSAILTLWATKIVCYDFVSASGGASGRI